MPRRGVQPNIFQKELNSIPTPFGNKMIFPYNSSKRDFIISENFNPSAAQGMITISEIEAVKERLRSGVENYDITTKNWLKPLIIISIGCLIGIITMAICFTQKKNNLGDILYFGIVLVFCGIGVYFNCQWEADVRKRGGDIKRIIEGVDREYHARSVRWSSGELGTYFMVAVGEGNGGQGMLTPAPIDNRFGGSFDVRRGDPNQYQPLID